jgi:type III secretion protein Q
LAITLVAELGTVRSSVGELQTLAAGCVLEVGERNPGEVTLRVQDGPAFAHGEMVDVGGRIGVRITRLAALP